jgi:hypothetical protein
MCLLLSSSSLAPLAVSSSGAPPWPSSMPVTPTSLATSRPKKTRNMVHGMGTAFGFDTVENRHVVPWMISQVRKGLLAFGDGGQHLQLVTIYDKTGFGRLCGLTHELLRKR